ncbi:MAG: acyltransferase [Candidatus Competibacteraceae bacterium]|nr:MAG: acyltransferase [Candidatus Competibacteraceae bacterium]
MEGIRGFAVFLVFLVHYVTLVDPWLTKASATQILSAHVRSIGNIGVDLFFVLSGYLIYGMLIRKKKPFGSYLARRIQRIYPTFVTVFLIYLLLSAAFPSESKIPDGWEGLIFVMQNLLLLPGLFDINAIITVAWSLSYEFFYYLLIPLLISLFRLREWNWKSRAALFICVSVLLFAYFAIYGGHIRLLMFISGILLFEVVEHKKNIDNIPPIGLPALALAIASVILLNAFEANNWWKFLLLFILFFIFCLECFSSEGISNRIFKFTPMRWLGNMSYSYYLIHGLALKFVFIRDVRLFRRSGSQTAGLTDRFAGS